MQELRFRITKPTFSHVSPELHLPDPCVLYKLRHAVDHAADYAALAAVTRGVEQQDTDTPPRHLTLQYLKLTYNGLGGLTSPEVHWFLVASRTQDT